MSRLMQQLLGGYMDEVKDDNAGGGGGETPEAKAAREAAAAKAAADAAAAAAAAGKKPTDEEARLLKEVMAKKEKAEKAEQRAKAAEEALKAYEGIDPVAIKKLMDDKKAADELELVRKGEFDTIKKQMNEQHEAAIKAERAKTEAVQAEVTARDSMIANLTIGNSFSGSAFVREDLALTPAKARVIYGSHFEFDREKQAIVGYDKPAGAKGRAPLVNAQGEPLGFDEAFKKIIEADPEKDSVLKSKVKTGASSSSQQQKATTEHEQGERKLTPVEKIEAGLKAQAAAKAKK